jgi:hypothetical protein
MDTSLPSLQVLAELETRGGPEIFLLFHQPFLSRPVEVEG